MTETPREPDSGVEPPTPTEPPPEGSEAAEGSARASEPPAEGEPSDDRARLRREAARYRTERNALRSQVAALQRAEVERRAGRLHDPADVWGVTELADLLADDGTVDAEAVSAAIDRLAEQKPYLVKSPPPTDFGAGARQPGVATTQPGLPRRLPSPCSRAP